MRIASGPAIILVCLSVHLACGSDSNVDSALDARPGADADASAPDRPTTGDHAIDVPFDAVNVEDTADADVDASPDAIREGQPPYAGNCPAQVLSAEESAAYFPFPVGARWVYRTTGTIGSPPTMPSLNRRDVTGTKMFGAAAAAIVVGPDKELSSKTSEDYLELTPGGVVDHGSSEPASMNERAGRFAAPFTAIPFPITTCVPYQAFDFKGIEVADVDLDGKPETLAGRATTTMTLEPVTAPVAAFGKALRVETIEDVTVTYSMNGRSGMPNRRHRIDWYAPGVGMVKHIVERPPYVTTSELIAHQVADARRGVVPAGFVARDLDEAPTNPYTPNRPAIGFDGKQFLVIVPISKNVVGTISDVGNLWAVVVDRDGNPVSSGPLLDSSSELTGVSIAWDGTRYLVAYLNAGYGRIELLTVSPTAQTLSGPLVLEQTFGLPAVVATKDGFLVAYAKTTRALGAPTDVSSLWLARVDAFGHPTSQVQPYPTSQQGTPSLAKDGADGVMALFNTPPPSPSTTNILAAARLTSDGRVVDPAPFPVDATPGVDHVDGQLIFDGTNFVAQWRQDFTSTPQMHVARITPAGALLDGPLSGGTGGIVIGGGKSPRLARFGSGSLAVWGHRLADFTGRGVGGTRITIDGKPLDLPGDNGGRWFLSDYDASDSSLVEVVWGADRALVVWANQADSNTNLFSVGCAVAHPW